jgi:guanylate kinase
MSNNGLIIVISAPSGAGKSTICSRLVAAIKKAHLSISYTTREPRPGERNGVDYFFVSKPKFKKMVSEHKFLEWALVHNNYYGTPKNTIRSSVNRGRDIILDIDVQGGLAVLVYIMTPTMKILEKRLRERKKDSEETIKMRLKNARKELKIIPKYDYMVINGRLQEAVKKVLSIVSVERERIVNKRIPSF